MNYEHFHIFCLHFEVVRESGINCLLFFCHLPSVIPENNSSFEQEDYDDLSEIKEGIQGSDNGE